MCGCKKWICDGLWLQFQTTTGAHFVRQNCVFSQEHEIIIIHPYILTKMNMLMEVVTLLYKADICLYMPF